jgi:hypothetical protein
MKCEECITLLDVLVDGRLEIDVQTALTDHIADCASCRLEHEGLRELGRRTAELPASIAPGRDLWPEIADRIQESKVVRGRFGAALRPSLLAAAAAAAVVGAVLVAYTVGRHQAHPTVVEVVSTPAAAPASLVSVVTAAAGSDFRLARSQLLEALEQRRDSLSPETIAVVDQNLGLIDSAIANITEALANDPGNQMLSDRLTTAYRQQIELLQKATRLPAEI